MKTKISHAEFLASHKCEECGEHCSVGLIDCGYALLCDDCAEADDSYDYDREARNAERKQMGIGG